MRGECGQPAPDGRRERDREVYLSHTRLHDRMAPDAIGHSTLSTTCAGLGTAAGGSGPAMNASILDGAARCHRRRGCRRRGDMQINGQGDGAAISEESAIDLTAASDAEVWCSIPERHARRRLATGRCMDGLRAVPSDPPDPLPFRPRHWSRARRPCAAERGPARRRGAAIVQVRQMEKVSGDEDVAGLALSRSRIRDGGSSG